MLLFTLYREASSGALPKSYKMVSAARGSEFGSLTPEPTLWSLQCPGQPRLGLDNSVQVSSLTAGAGQPLWWVWPP